LSPVSSGLDARTRHLTPVPTAAFVALDMLVLAVAGFLTAAVQDRIGPVALAADLPGRLFPVAGFRPAWMLAHVVLLPVAFLALGQYRMLQPGTRGWSFGRILLSFLGLGAVLLAFLWLIGHEPDHAYAAASGVAGLAGVTAARAIANHRLRHQVLSGQRARNVLVVGTSPQAQEVAREAVANPLLGRRIVGFVGDDGGPRLSGPPEGAWAPTDPDALRQAIVENSLRQPRHLWAAYPARDEDGMRAVLDGLGAEEVYLEPTVPTPLVEVWLRLCQARGVDVHLMPVHHFGLGLRPAAWQFGRFVLLDIHRRPFSLLGWWAKRLMDIAGGAFGLLVFSPVIALTALAIKVETPGNPVFYPGRRVGMKGRIFRMAKFTTMRPDAQRLEETLQAENQREGPWFKLDSARDPRLTRVGRFIRKYSINEIPQFWNVLKGDMSLVGPRPPIPEEVATYLNYDVRYFQVLDVKPGMTGLWQVTAKNDPSFDRRIALDIQYMREWSIGLDVRILLRTLLSVVRDRED
jgi:exopolysaccharide biosynthesis polyprenyl glycosylphosphotransferase